MNIHFSSKTDQWETPLIFFIEMESKYGKFDLDVCADETNNKSKKYYTKENDGLRQSWHLDGSNIWMNPPYGREIKKWVHKAYEESKHGCRVVCLLPARVDTSWFHDYCTKGKVTFLRGRLKFGDSKNSAPFPSMIVVFE